jgi:hypothetical protein
MTGHPRKRRPSPPPLGNQHLCKPQFWHGVTCMSNRNAFSYGSWPPPRSTMYTHYTFHHIVLLLTTWPAKYPIIHMCCVYALGPAEASQHMCISINLCPIVNISCVYALGPAEASSICPSLIPYFILLSTLPYNAHVLCQRTRTSRSPQHMCIF